MPVLRKLFAIWSALGLASCFWGAASLPILAAELPLLTTELAQLEGLLRNQSRVKTSIDLHGVALSFDSKSGLLTLQDASSVQILKIPPSLLTVEPGDRVRLYAETSEWSRAAMGVALELLPASAPNPERSTAVSLLTLLQKGEEPAPAQLFTEGEAPGHPVWAQFEGRLRFASDGSGGWEAEAEEGRKRARVIVLGGEIRGAALTNSFVKIIGVRFPAVSAEGANASALVAPGWDHVTAARPVSAGAPKTSLLSQVSEIRKLTLREAEAGAPFQITGVITCLKPESGSAVIQDASEGLLINHFYERSTVTPVLGEVWKVEGFTAAGENGAQGTASLVERIGIGLFPEPIHPGWDQLMNGSLDSQYAEIQGIITDVRKGAIGVLTSAGRIRLQLSGNRAEELKACRNKLVRIRGCLFALWHPQTHRIRSGELAFIDPMVIVDQEGETDPFSIPPRRVAELLGFEARNGQLERSRVRGQLLHEWGGEHYLLDGTNGLRFTTDTRLGLAVGDIVDVVGYPLPGGASVVMREPVTQRTGHEPLPAPTRLDLTRVLAKGYDATWVQVEGFLVNTIEGEKEDEMEVQAGFRTFVARLRSSDGVKPSLEIGSRLQLTGVYSSLVNNGVPALGIDTFELLINSASDIRVLSRPPWWTLNKLLSILGVSGAVLLAAFVWIGQLRRRVALRTAEVEQQIKARQRLEQQQAMDQERARVAHDLHDELGAGLTEVGILGSLARTSAIPADKKERYLLQLTEMSRQLVTTLDEIVWAINPKYDSVSSLVSYFCLFAQRFLELASVSCRLEIPEVLPPAPLESRSRHAVFLAFKESLNNVVKHSGAKEVRLTIRMEGGILAIVVSDDGAGFTMKENVPGLDGLASMKNRLSTLGGDCQIESSPGQGTVVTFTLPMK